MAENIDKLSFYGSVGILTIQVKFSLNGIYQNLPKCT